MPERLARLYKIGDAAQNFNYLGANHREGGGTVFTILYGEVLSEDLGMDFVPLQVMS